MAEDASATSGTKPKKHGDYYLVIIMMMIKGNIISKQFEFTVNKIGYVIEMNKEQQRSKDRSPSYS